MSIPWKIYQLIRVERNEKKALVQNWLRVLDRYCIFRMEQGKYLIEQTGFEVYLQSEPKGWNEFQDMTEAVSELDFFTVEFYLPLAPENRVLARIKATFDYPTTPGRNALAGEWPGRMARISYQINVRGNENLRMRSIERLARELSLAGNTVQFVATSASEDYNYDYAKKEWITPHFEGVNFDPVFMPHLWFAVVDVSRHGGLDPFLKKLQDHEYQYTCEGIDPDDPARRVEILTPLEATSRTPVRR